MAMEKMEPQRKAYFNGLTPEEKYFSTITFLYGTTNYFPDTGGLSPEAVKASS